MRTQDISQFTDIYFSKSKDALATSGRNPVVVWQVFQKHSAIFCGLGLIRDILEMAEEVHTLKDGDPVEPFEPAMLIKAPVQSFIEFETVYLGIIARCTRIATNVRRVVAAAAGKPVLFFPARFDVPETQFYDGYAAFIGGAAGCATQTQTAGFNLAMKLTNAKDKDGNLRKPVEPVGTMPHALIAAFEGDVVAASLAMAEALPNESIWALVDFNNNCGEDAVAVYNAFKDKGIEHRLAGIRLDTSEKLIDKGIAKFNSFDPFGQAILTGVCPSLVGHVRRSLDNAGARDVKIGVSGGFSAEKVQRFEMNRVPVDVYAVGESFLAGANAFTSDIVARFEGAKMIPCGKVGRELKTSKRLTQIIGITVPA